MTLLPELAEAMVEMELTGTWIKHPFVNQLYFGPMQDEHCNQTFEVKKGAVASALEGGRWREFIILHERPWRLHALVEIMDRVPDADYWKLVLMAWVDAETPWRNLPTWEDLWQSERPGRAKQKLPESALDGDGMVRVYRGQDRSEMSGLSWTLDRGRAEWFALRFAHEGSVGYLFEGTVEQADVLAYLDDRNEEEIVALWVNVEHITELEPTDP